MTRKTHTDRIHPDYVPLSEVIGARHAPGRHVSDRAAASPPDLPENAMIDVTVWASVELPGVHRWPDAPDHRDYLRETHRHLFRVTVTVVPDDDSRSVDTHDIQAMVRGWWGAGMSDWGANSCEALARQIGKTLIRQGLPVVTVDVSEDGECGATVRWD